MCNSKMIMNKNTPDICLPLSLRNRQHDHSIRQCGKSPAIFLYIFCLYVKITRFSLRFASRYVCVYYVLLLEAYSVRSLRMFFAYIFRQTGHKALHHAAHCCRYCTSNTQTYTSQRSSRTRVIELSQLRAWAAKNSAEPFTFYEVIRARILRPCTQPLRYSFRLLSYSAVGHRSIVHGFLAKRDYVLCSML